MSAKTEASRSSESEIELGPIESEFTLGDDGSDSGHVTLARALEDAAATREAVFKMQQETLEEIERFRQAFLREMKDRKRARGMDARDGLLGMGMASMGVGVAVAFHWAYSLIACGLVFMAMSVASIRAQKRRST